MENRYAPPQANVSDVGATGAVSAAMADAMRGTKPWVLLVGITLLVVAAFSVLAGFGIMVGAGAQQSAPGGAAMFAGMSAFYIVFAAMYLFLGLYLVKYSSAIGRLLNGGQSGDMEQALHQQRKFWKLAGILTSVVIVLMVVGIGAAILIPTLMK